MAKRRKAQTPVEASQSTSGTSSSMKQPSLSDVALDPEIMRQMAAAISRQGVSGRFASSRPPIAPELVELVRKAVAAGISFDLEASRPQLSNVWDKALQPMKELEAERQLQLAERQRVEQEIQEERRLRIELMRKQLSEPPQSKRGRLKGSGDPARKKWIGKAKALKSRGLTDTEVADELAKQGCKRSRTTINGWLNESIR